MLNQLFPTLDYADLVKESKHLDLSLAPQKLRLALLADTATQRLVTLLRVLFHRNGIDCSFSRAALMPSAWMCTTGIQNFIALLRT